MRTSHRNPVGWRYVCAGVLLTAMAAHPIGSRADDAHGALPPLSNRQAAERAVARALDNLGIPGGNGREVSCRIERKDGAGDQLLDIMAVEFLVRLGYRVRMGDTVPGFTFRADSLAVDIERRGGILAGRVERRAEATIVAVFRETADTHTTCRARGVYEDAIPAQYLKHAGLSEPFVNDHSRSAFALKPVLFGLIVTGMVWLLYLYRG